MSRAGRAAEQAVAVRASVGIFRLSDRGLIEVGGGDRVRWLDGMLSNDITSLRVGVENSGCRAVTLTAKGRIVADLHVLARDASFWLETAAAAVPRIIEHFERHLVADDVSLRDLGPSIDRLAVEGTACGVVARVRRGSPAGSCGGLLQNSSDRRDRSRGGSLRLVGRDRLPIVGAGRQRRVRCQGDRGGWIQLEPISAGPKTLEILRIETGTPQFGAEIDETVLPAEARLGCAVARSKGCYVGQEVVARMEAAGRMSHLLVGLALGEAPIPEPGSEITASGKRVGEVTSSCLSALAGSIALGFVRTAHSATGTERCVAGQPVRVAALPFAGPGASAP